MTLQEAHTRVISALTQYDQRLEAGERRRGGHVNIYRLSHYFGAAQRALEGAATLAQYRAGLEREFERGFPPIDRFLWGACPKCKRLLRPCWNDPALLGCVSCDETYPKEGAAP